MEGGHSQPAYYTQALALCRRLLAQPSLPGRSGRTTGAFARAGGDAARPLCAMLPHSLWRLSCQQAMNTAVTQHGHAYLARLAQLARQEFPEQPGWLACLYVDSLSAQASPAHLALMARHAGGR